MDFSIDRVQVFSDDGRGVDLPSAGSPRVTSRHDNIFDSLPDTTQAICERLGEVARRLPVTSQWRIRYDARVETHHIEYSVNGSEWHEAYSFSAELAYLGAINIETLARFVYELNSHPVFRGVDPGGPEGDQTTVRFSPPASIGVFRWRLVPGSTWEYFYTWTRNYIGSWPIPTQRDREADARGEQLLLDNLSDDQRGCYQKYGWFYVTAPSGRCYCIYRASNYNVNLIENDKIVSVYCLQPTDPAIPLADQLLSQKLLLEANEEYFLQTANVR